MIAGAPDAFGSLVILSSSGEMGSHSSPLTMRVRAIASAVKITTTRKNTRREFTTALQGLPSKGAHNLSLFREKAGPTSRPFELLARPGLNSSAGASELERGPSHGDCYRPR